MLITVTDSVRTHHMYLGLPKKCLDAVESSRSLQHCLVKCSVPRTAGRETKTILRAKSKALGLALGWIWPAKLNFDCPSVRFDTIIVKFLIGHLANCTENGQLPAAILSSDNLLNSMWKVSIRDQSTSHL